MTEVTLRQLLPRLDELCARHYAADNPVLQVAEETFYAFERPQGKGKNNLFAHKDGPGLYTFSHTSTTFPTVEHWLLSDRVNSTCSTRNREFKARLFQFFKTLFETAVANGADEPSGRTDRAFEFVFPHRRYLRPSARHPYEPTRQARQRKEKLDARHENQQIRFESRPDPPPRRATIGRPYVPPMRERMYPGQQMFPLLYGRPGRTSHEVHIAEGRGPVAPPAWTEPLARTEIPEEPTTLSLAGLVRGDWKRPDPSIPRAPPTALEKAVWRMQRPHLPPPP